MVVFKQGIGLLRTIALLSCPYEKEGALVSITAGAGSTDSQVISHLQIKCFPVKNM